MLCERSSLGAPYGVLRPGPIKGTSPCDKWRLNLALTFVMSEQQLVSIVRRYSGERSTRSILPLSVFLTRLEKYSHFDPGDYEAWSFEGKYVELRSFVTPSL